MLDHSHNSDLRGASNLVEGEVTSTLRDQYILVKTKTGSYYHPVRSLAYENVQEGGGEYSASGEYSATKRLGCMDKPTRVWECDEKDLQTMKPCVACAMWIVYGRVRG